MNFVFLSPHFPPNFYLFCVQLNNMGVNVFGLADEPYHLLNPALKSALREYYRVNNMHNYDELLRAMGFLTFRHGRLDRLDSQNEYWLETEARLRDDFNIFGLHTADMPAVKRKRGHLLGCGRFERGQDAARGHGPDVDRPIRAASDDVPAVRTEGGSEMMVSQLG